jgi:hypothetical protein
MCFGDNGSLVDLTAVTQIELLCVPRDQSFLGSWSTPQIGTGGRWPSKQSGQLAHGKFRTTPSLRCKRHPVRSYPGTLIGGLIPNSE